MKSAVIYLGNQQISETSGLGRKMPYREEVSSLTSFLLHFLQLPTRQKYV